MESDMKGWWCVRYGDALAWVEAPSAWAALRRCSLDLVAVAQRSDALDFDSSCALASGCGDLQGSSGSIRPEWSDIAASASRRRLRPCRTCIFSRRYHLPRNSGARFSKNAAIPSPRSSVVNRLAVRWRSNASAESRPIPCPVLTATFANQTLNGALLA